MSLRYAVSAFVIRGRSSGSAADPTACPFGVHSSITIPFGTYRNAMRFGAAAVAAHAGLIASRNGSEIAAPIPCSIARRESLLLGFISASLRSLPHLERTALDDPEHQARKLVLSGRRLPRDLVHRLGIRGFQFTPQRKRQQFLCHVPRKQPRLRTQNAL